MEKITLCKDGVLTRTYWFYDEQIKKGEYRTKEVDHLTAYLMHDMKCTFEEGLLLKDIFLFINKHLDYVDLCVGNWCRDFVEEGLKDPQLDPESELESLELYWYAQKTLDEGKASFYLPNKMDFHGYGKPYPLNPGDENSATQTNYGITLTPTKHLSLLPIKIDPELKVYIEDYDTKNYNIEPIHLGECHPTLFQVLYGIIWELSFHGGPAKRQAFSDELTKSVEEIKNGTAKLVPFEDLFKDDEDTPEPAAQDTSQEND